MKSFQQLKLLDISCCVLLAIVLVGVTVNGSTVSSTGSHPTPPTPPTPTPPVFSDQYYVEGVLSLPYAEITEPFVGYYDGPNNRSRVDYYGDLEQTIQRAGDSGRLPDGGISYKIAWMVDRQGDPQRVCFQVNGTQEQPVSAQSVIPDLQGFQRTDRGVPCAQLITNRIVGTGRDSQLCDRWQSIVTVDQKVNKYVFLVRYDSTMSSPGGQQQQPIPVHYEMMGYDSLLGSHYDKYEIQYKNYRIGPMDSGIFNVPENISCRGFPGPGLEHRGHHNPISEFTHGQEGHTDQEFDQFQAKHAVSYPNTTDHRQRKHVFRQNLRYIFGKNRQNSRNSYRLAVNHLADMTDQELASRFRRGRLYSGVHYNGGLEFDKNRYLSSRSANNMNADDDDIPDQWDWRLAGGVTPVKDQAVCGSCWSFGTVGTIEGVLFARTGRLLKLSEQQLVDCSWNQLNNGCDGGEDFRAYDYIQKSGGLATSDQYGQYLGADGKCHDKQLVGKLAVRLSGFYNVTPGDPQALRTALYYEGPVTVAIDASHKSLSFYSSGVYYEPQCGNKPENLDHQVLAVGYGQLRGEKYWLIKNSWSTYWGNDGYVLISQRDNNCGVLTSPTFPKLADDYDD